jgi:hypothetical protein
MFAAILLIGVQVVCVIAAFASDDKSKKNDHDDGPYDPGHFCS